MSADPRRLDGAFGNDDVDPLLVARAGGRDRASVEADNSHGETCAVDPLKRHGKEHAGDVTDDLVRECTALRPAAVTAIRVIHC